MDAEGMGDSHGRDSPLSVRTKDLAVARDWPALPAQAPTRRRRSAARAEASLDALPWLRRDFPEPLSPQEQLPGEQV